MEEKIVLCVDDEINILHSLKRLLRKEPYELITTDSPDGALEILKEKKIHLIISDHKMPKMSGVELLQEAKNIDPNIIRVILSGYAEIHVVVEAINQGEIYRFLYKPWTDSELKMNILQCLEQYDLVQSNIELAEELKGKNAILKTLNDQLEETVKNRTSVLKYTQDIVQCLPIPIAGVSPDGLLVLFNQALENFIGKSILYGFGSEIMQVFPKDLVGRINDFMEGDKKLITFPYFLNQENVCVRINKLEEQDVSRGCILTLERDSNDQSLQKTA